MLLLDPLNKLLPISEAVRGEGAILLNDAGEQFMTGIHPLADLAPRDVVAKAIMSQMLKAGCCQS